MLAGSLIVGGVACSLPGEDAEEALAPSADRAVLVLAYDLQRLEVEHRRALFAVSLRLEIHVLHEWDATGHP